jgi:hypothetical protein
MPIGSIAGGLIGMGGANAAAGQALSMANQAYLANQHQMEVNRSDMSPWTNSGRNALNEIGALLGWGRLQNEGKNGTLWEWDNDPTGKTRKDAYQRIENWINAANGGVNPPQLDLLNVPTTFQADPGYQFRLAEGQKALDRTAASRGKLLSGAQFKASQDYNQGMASNEYGNWWNRYTSGTAANNATKMQDYSNKYSSRQGALGNYFNLLNGLSGQGLSGQGGVNSANSGLANSAGNYLTSAGQYAGNAYMSGANALASGIGSGINNAMTLGWMGFNPTSGWFRGGGQSGFGMGSARPGGVGRAGMFGANF